MLYDISLQWRHNRLGGVSNHHPHHCSLSRLLGRRSKKTSKLRVTGLCAGISSGTGEVPAQMASNAENVSIWWRHHVVIYLWEAQTVPHTVNIVVADSLVMQGAKNIIHHDIYIVLPASTSEWLSLTHLPLDKMAAILADDIFKRICLNENVLISITISL